MAIRSGRFNDSIDVNTPITLVQGHSDAFYRIFNSGEAVVNVTHSNSQVSELKPTFSLDVVVKTTIQITTDSVNPVLVEGIYEFLDGHSEIRSGRFRLKPDDNPQVNHKIISTEGGSDAYYRIFNSGEHPIKVWRGAQSLVDSLKPEQSFDFEAAGNRDYFVNSPDAHPISGIYDFLGKGG